jgi:hypothetical protein
MTRAVLAVIDLAAANAGFFFYLCGAEKQISPGAECRGRPQRARGLVGRASPRAGRCRPEHTPDYKPTETNQCSCGPASPGNTAPA